jgi:hypothetical protein
VPTRLCHPSTWLPLITKPVSVSSQAFSPGNSAGEYVEKENLSDHP